MNIIPDQNENISDEPIDNVNLDYENLLKRLTASDAQVIYKSFDTKDDSLAKELCYSHRYSKSTFSNIIKKEGKITEKYKKPERKKKWEDDELKKVIEFIGENPVLNLEEIVDKTVEETKAKRIANLTISDYLKSELIIMKSCRLDPIARNTLETKQSRKKYCNEILNRFTDPMSSLTRWDMFAALGLTIRDSTRFKKRDSTILMKRDSTILTKKAGGAKKEAGEAKELTCEKKIQKKYENIRL